MDTKKGADSGQAVRNSKQFAKQLDSIAHEERERRFESAKEFIVSPAEWAQKPSPEERQRLFEEAGERLQAEWDRLGVSEDEILKAIKETRSS